MAVRLPSHLFLPYIPPTQVLTSTSTCTFGLCSISFILAEAIPIFSYLLALTGSICFAPLTLMIPGCLWLYDHGEWRKGTFAKQIGYWLHWGMILLGAFLLVGGTYATVQEIIDAYASGEIGKLNYWTSDAW